jgi:hypothetical protein
VQTKKRRTDFKPITTAGDLERAGLACEALVMVLLAEDERVQQVYETWLTTHDATLVTVLVRNVLALDYAWLPDLLVQFFAVATLGGAGLVGPDRPLRVEPDLTGIPAARRSKHRGQHLLRDTVWYYRAEIKSPTDDMATLTREYALETGRATAAHSVVYAGIQRVKRGLSIFHKNDLIA